MQIILTFTKKKNLWACAQRLVYIYIYIYVWDYLQAKAFAFGMWSTHLCIATQENQRGAFSFLIGLLDVLN